MEQSPSYRFGARSMGVKAGANPNEPPIGRVAARTPLMTTSYKDASVAEALLKAGARLEDIDDGRYCALVRRVCRQLARSDRATRGRSKPSGVGGNLRHGMRTASAPERRSAGVVTVLDRGRPTVEDFDRVLALLESAEKHIKR